MTSEATTAHAASCSACHPVRASAWERYREFLLSRETILVLANALLLLTGFVVSVAGAPEAGRWLYLASALVGGAPWGWRERISLWRPREPA